MLPPAEFKKISDMEFYDVKDKETFEERYVSVSEQGGGKLNPERST